MRINSFTHKGKTKWATPLQQFQPILLSPIMSHEMVNLPRITMIAQKIKVFLDEFKNVLDGSVTWNVSYWQLKYYLFHCHMTFFQTKSCLHLSSHSAFQLTTHPMDLYDQFMKSLAKNWVSTLFVNNPNMDMFPCDLTLYLSSTSAVQKFIKNSIPGSSSESKLMHSFKEVDKPDIQEFIEHPTWTQCKSSFLNFFMYFSQRPNKITTSDICEFL